MRYTTAPLLLGLAHVALWQPTTAAQVDVADVGPAHVIGYVFAANGTSPIPDAHVALTNLAAGITIRTVTDQRGQYILRGVSPGNYRFDVRRIGFRPTQLVLDVVDAKPVHLSIALDLHPVLLSPLAITARTVLSPEALSEQRTIERVRDIKARQSRYLSHDVREVTAHEVTEAMTLGDGDVLRALQTIPGIATKSDWTAELWTRGGRWDQTRVYFDGVPVFNPLHTFGMFSAISAEAIERVRIHPGLKPASFSEGAAGIVEVISASGKNRDKFSGSASFSTFQGGATARQPIQNGRGGIALSGRMGNTNLRRDSPYGFLDFTGRFDLALTQNTSLETSFLWSGDRLREYASASALTARADWQNAVARSTVVAHVGNTTLRQTIGFSQASARTQRITPSPGPGLPTVTWPTDNSLDQITVRGDVATTSAAAFSWRGGYEIQSLKTHYFGSPTAPYALQTFIDTLTYLDRAEVKSAWGELTWKPFGGVAVETGLRVEAGGASTPLRAGPRLAIRAKPFESFQLSAAYGRSFQYVQTLAGSGAVIGPGLQISQVWLLAGPQVPVLQADIITAGAELWVSPKLLAGVNLYQRVSSGVVIDDPRPGFSSTRALFETASNDARGFEMSLRKLSGQWTGGVSYAHGKSTMHALGVAFPSAAEREHVVDATLHSELPHPVMYGIVRIGVATRVASGAPFTRLLPCPPACSSSGSAPINGLANNQDDGQPSFDLIQLPAAATDELPTERASTEWVGQPNAVRAPGYWNVDATVEWSRSFNRAQVTAYMQIRNLFNRTNAVTYIRAGDAGCAAVSNTTLRSIAGDCFESGIPFRPIFGMRIQF